MYAICMFAAVLPFETCLRYIIFDERYVPVLEKDTSERLAVNFYHLISHSSLSFSAPLFSTRMSAM